MKKIISIMMSLCMVMSMCANVLAKPSLETEVTALDGFLGGILGVVKVIGYTFAVGMLLYVGIKYVMASANEKADLKKGSISYVIGAVIIFGASTLISVMETLSGQVAVE